MIATTDATASSTLGHQEGSRTVAVSCSKPGGQISHSDRLGVFCFIASVSCKAAFAIKFDRGQHLVDHSHFRFLAAEKYRCNQFFWL